MVECILVVLDAFGSSLFTTFGQHIAEHRKNSDLPDAHHAARLLVENKASQMMPIEHRSEKLGLGLIIQYELTMRLSLWRALPWLVSNIRF